MSTDPFINQNSQIKSKSCWDNLLCCFKPNNQQQNQQINNNKSINKQSGISLHETHATEAAQQDLLLQQHQSQTLSQKQETSNNEDSMVQVKEEKKSNFQDNLSDTSMKSPSKKAKNNNMKSMVRNTLLNRSMAQDINQKQYILNEIQSFNSSNNLFQILAKFTEAKIIIPNQTKDYICDQKYIFSLYDTGIKMGIDFESKVTPEQIAQHIAKRAKNCRIIIDAFCGVGGNTIQFARQSDFVYAIDIEDQKVSFTKHNCEKYYVNNVDFIKADFLKMSSLKGDMVFLSPNFTETSNPLEYDLLQNSEPDLLDSMKTAIQISNNIMIQIPAKIGIDQVPELFNRFYKENEKLLPTDSYAVEIEQIFVNNRLEYYLIHYGITANITNDEIMSYLIKILQNSDSVSENIQEQSLYNVLNKIKESLGVIGLCKYMRKAQRKKQEDPKTTTTLLQFFIDHIVQDKILTQQWIKQQLNVKNNYSISEEDFSKYVSSNSSKNNDEPQMKPESQSPQLPPLQRKSKGQINQFQLNSADQEFQLKQSSTKNQGNDIDKLSKTIQSSHQQEIIVSDTYDNDSLSEQNNAQSISQSINQYIIQGQDIKALSVVDQGLNDQEYDYQKNNSQVYSLKY